MSSRSSSRRSFAIAASIAAVVSTLAVAPVAEARPIKSFSWSRTSVDFGTVSAGSSSVETLTLTNTGTTTVRKPAVTLSPTTGTEFSITANTCAVLILDPGTGTCEVQVTFAPTATGAQSASVTVLAGKTAFTVSLSGIGGAPSPDSVISAGNGHSCALTTAGGVKCWGANNYGQLGNSTSSPDPTSTPVDVTGLTSGVAGIDSGTENSCALTTGGGVKCWGSNYKGQLGNGSTAGYDEFSSTPVDVTGLSSGVAAVATGYWFSCALMTTGAVKCWGWGVQGTLGNGSFADSNVPVDVSGFETGGAIALDVSGEHACVITTGGGVKCWGSSYFGQLGNGAFDDSNVPVDVVGLSSGVLQVSAGGYHTCALLATGAKCWGFGEDGELGNNGTVDSPTPVDVIVGRRTPLAGIASIHAGRYHTCVRTTVGGVKCWGYNLYGQIGDSGAANALMPVDVVGLTSGVSSVSVGGYHTCVRTSSGGAKCWGAGSDGELGNNATEDSATPVDVVGFPAASSAARQADTTDSAAAAEKLRLQTANVRY